MPVDFVSDSLKIAQESFEQMMQQILSYTREKTEQLQAKGFLNDANAEIENLKLYIQYLTYGDFRYDRAEVADKLTHYHVDLSPEDEKILTKNATEVSASKKAELKQTINARKRNLLIKVFQKKLTELEPLNHELHKSYETEKQTAAGISKTQRQIDVLAKEFRNTVQLIDAPTELEKIASIMVAIRNVILINERFKASYLELQSKKQSSPLTAVEKEKFYQLEDILDLKMQCLKDLMKALNSQIISWEQQNLNDIGKNEDLNKSFATIQKMLINDGFSQTDLDKIAPRGSLDYTDTDTDINKHSSISSLDSNSTVSTRDSSEFSNPQRLSKIPTINTIQRLFSILNSHIRQDRALESIHTQIQNDQYKNPQGLKDLCKDILALVNDKFKDKKDLAEIQDEYSNLQRYIKLVDLSQQEDSTKLKDGLAKLNLDEIRDSALDVWDFYVENTQDQKSKAKLKPSDINMEAAVDGVVKFMEEERLHSNPTHKI